MREFYQRRFSLSWHSITSIRQSIFHVFQRMHIDNNDIDRVGMAITEYLSNVLRHANGEDTPVTIIMASELETVHVTIIDTTRFYHQLQPSDADQELTMQEGGMGLSLIQSFFPDFQYYSQDNENHFVISIDNQPRPARVFVLDDSQSLLQLTGAYLSEHYDVECFDQSDQAIKAMHNRLPDVLLVDLYMPNLSGIDVVKRIRQSERLASISIIFISTDFRPQTIRKLNSLGIDDFIAKPVPKTALLQVLDRVLMRRTASFDSLPEPQRQKSIELGSRSLSMRGALCNEQGGDFLISTVSSHSGMFILADVMGHGPQAKLDSYAIRGFISGVLQDSEITPAALLSKISNALYHEVLLKGSLVTLLICSVNGDEVSWISAGHPNPILISKEGKVLSCGTVQPLPGLNPEQQFYNQTLKLNKNESLVFHTDGWVENFDKKISPCAMIEKCLEPLLEKQLDLQFPNLLIDELWQFSSGRLTQEIDDASLLVLS